MNTKTNTVVETQIAELFALITNLESKIVELQTKIEPKRNEAQREMTDDDAYRIMTGDLKDSKHKDAAAQLGLSYGQVYSARGEYTFKHIHKALKAVEGYKNVWVK